MAKLTINRGSLANDGTGDNLREGANKINLNFDEIYTAIGDGSTVDGTIKIADDSSTVATISANGETLRIIGGNAITSTITGNTLEIAADTSALLSASGTATITNKTIDLDANTVTGTTAEFNTALQDGSFTTLAGTEALTNKDLTGSGNTFPTITIRDDSSTEDAVSLGETLIATGGTGITSTVGSNQLTFAIDSTVATLTGSQTLTNKTIVAGNNTISGITNAMLSGSAGITNANLANSSITLGDDSISLGGTQTTVTNLSLDGATGTIDLTSSGNKIRFNFATDGDFPTASTYEGMYAWDVADSLPYVADDGGWVKILTENASVGDLSNVNISGVADGNVLVWSSAQGRFNVGAASGGISDVVDDTTPQLGGGLDSQANYITDASYLAIRAADVGNVINTITVTVATKTTEHPAHGTGSSNGYVLDGIESPALTLAKGTYRFDQSDSSNSGHPLLFYYDVLKARAWTTDVTTNGTPGSAGAYTQIDITSDTPRRLAYQCSSHARMGHEADVQGGKTTNLNIETDKSNTGDGSATTITLNTNDRTVDNVLVFVNGICLVPTDDYTISGTTLTFATAPANNAEIVVRYLG